MKYRWTSSLIASVLIALPVAGCGDKSQSLSPANPPGDGADAKTQLPKADTDQNNAFVVADEFSVDTPADGYRWSLARTMEVEGTPVRVYACTKEGSTSAIVLSVQEWVAPDVEAARRATLKAHYNTLVTVLGEGGFTDVLVRKPSLDSPIPARVPFAVKCKKPTGEDMYIHCITAFGRSIYSLQATADTVEQADHFLEVINSFRELPRN